MVPLCSMVPLDTQASWLMECLLLLIWPSIQRIPVEMLLWPRCQGQRGVTWVTTFFYETDSYCFFTKSVFFFEMVKMRSRRSGWGQLVPSVLIWFFLKTTTSRFVFVKVNSNHTLCECGPWASQKVERDDWLFEAFWVKVTPCVVVSWVKVRERSENWGWCPLTFWC